MASAADIKGRGLAAARDLFPAIEPYDAGSLPVGGPHRLYWEQSGNPKGRPAVFLHGGPGAGSSPDHRRFFDPAHYRIVVFDQRGAGRSNPLGEIRDNTTSHLVSDIEVVRDHLAIERWQVFGGSWGSTLALAYAQSHPERVEALVLRGIFLCRQQEIDWFITGMRRFFPEHWQAFAGFIPEAERDDLLAAYYRRLTDPDPAVHLPAAKAWSLYEGRCSTLLPSESHLASFSDPQTALGIGRIEAHYFINRGFMAEGQLLAGLPRISHIPAAIIHGRYDVICPAVSADELHRAWPQADYEIIPDAGHSAMEPGIRRALVAATEKFKQLG